MRADRLVALLLLLQQRSRVTAAEVAAELEISERTARRDLDALGLAGLPVYSQRGRNGGWRLAGGGRTDLSGLTSTEAQALFLVAGPSAAATPELRAALRKLVRALPEQFRVGAQAAASAVVVDQPGWGNNRAPSLAPQHLDEVQRCVVMGLQVSMSYSDRRREATTRVIEPLGLAAKGNVWYLVADTVKGRRTFRVDRITSIEPTGQAATRPANFDLASAWRSISEEVEGMRAATMVTATALIVRERLTLCRRLLATRLQIGPSTDDGRVRVQINGFSIDALAGELGGFGSSIEVLEPSELREALARIGRQLQSMYSSNDN
ncbi:MAG: putative transcriptional regulator [Acidimicrobiaceae bacterium]|nr:MAG: putative transcriptional regulator [Acidimicrobiaceae bacterium]